MNMTPETEGGTTDPAAGAGQDPKSKVQEIIGRLKSDLAELEAAETGEEQTEEQPIPEEAGSVPAGGEVPFQKKKQGFLAKGLGL